MFANFLNKNRRHPDYDEDFFKDTRMSFGDHLEELRTRMWRAIKGLGVFLILGFILDGLGDRFNLPWLGIGKPMLKVIIDPVEEQVKQFYHERNLRIHDEVAGAEADDKRRTTVEVRTKLPIQPLLDTFDGS